MERLTSTILKSLPGSPAHPESPDLIRLLGGPRGERAPRTCGCQGIRDRHCLTLLSLGVDRGTVVTHADAQLYDAGRCPDTGCVWRSLLALVFAGDLVLADLHCSRLSEQPRWSGTGPAAQVVQIVRSRIGFLAGDPGGADSGSPGGPTAHSADGIRDVRCAQTSPDAPSPPPSCP